MAVIFSQQNNIRSRLFVEKKLSSLRFAIALVLAVGLLISDHHNRNLSKYIRSVFSILVTPLQFAVDYPVRIVGWAGSVLGSKQSLIVENMRLRYKQTMLEASLQKLMTIQAENSELKSLLLASTSDDTQAMVGQILAIDTSSNRHIVIINKGSRDKVSVGQAVLDSKGVMGQVIDVGFMTSTVLLISDYKCAVPVRNERTGENAILVGNNDMSNLSLINLPKTSNIAIGDLLVTSGLGRRYPEGYPVGRVTKVIDNTDDDFIKVSVYPIANLNRSRLVLLIWPQKDHNDLTKQINERLKALEEGFV